MAAIASCEDISTEILLRLPAMSVLNLQTLSKLWFSIISRPRFRQTHASRHKELTPAGHFFVGRDDNYGTLGYLPISQTNPKLSYHDIRVDPDSKYHLFRSTSSCNGLLLLKSSKLLYLYNPTTKECKTLNIPMKFSDTNYLFVNATLAFDPSQSSHYKVAVLWKWRQNHRDDFKLEVYSSVVTGKCKTPKCISFYSSYLNIDKSGIFCNGSIHWLTHNNYLIYFDVDSERIKYLKCPSSFFGEVYFFGQVRGRIIYVKYEDEKDIICFLNVYELKRDYSGWDLKYRAEHVVPESSRIQQRYGTIYRAMSIFMYEEEEEEEEDLTMVILVGEEWVKYNLEKKTEKSLCKLPLSFNSYFCWINHFSTHQFIPTLACL